MIDKNVPPWLLQLIALEAMEIGGMLPELLRFGEEFTSREHSRTGIEKTIRLMNDVKNSGVFDT